MSFELNPLELFRGIMSLKYGVWLAIPAALVALVLLFFVALLAVNALAVQGSAGSGVDLAEELLAWRGFGTAATALLVAMFVLWGSMFVLVAKRGDAAAVLSPPRVLLSGASSSRLEDGTFQYRAMLDIDSPFAITRLTVIAKAPSISAMAFGRTSAGITMRSGGHSEGEYHTAIEQAYGTWELTLTMVEREPVEIEILVGDKSTIRRTFRP